MDRYAIYVHLEVLDALPRRGSQRRKVFDFLRSLQDSPFTPGDYSESDASLRIRQIKVIGDYAVVYWTDHPVKTVMVVDIRRAD